MNKHAFTRQAGTSVLLSCLSAILAAPCLSGQGDVAKPVTAKKAKAGPLDQKVSLQAEVLPLESLRIVPRVTGYLKKIAVREGDMVERDALLIELDCPDREADLRIAAAELKEAAAMVTVAETAINTAKQGEVVAKSKLAVAKSLERLAQVAHRHAVIEYNRVKNLALKGAATQAELDKAELEMRRCEADMAADKAQTEAARSDVLLAEAMTSMKESGLQKARAEADRVRAAGELAAVFESFTEVKNPYPKARITRQLLDSGNLVRANQTEILEIMNVTKVRIRIPVPEVDAARVRAGTEVRIIPKSSGDNGAGKDVIAKITRVTGAVDVLSRTMPAEVELDNTNNSWIPGSLCQVELTVAKIASAITIDSSALVREKADYFVWVVTDGRANKKPVRLGIDGGSWVQVVEGLAADQVVITKGIARLRENDPVKATIED